MTEQDKVEKVRRRVSTCGLPANQISAVIEEMFTKHNTIPFIERYRKNRVAGISPTDMRFIADVYEDVEDTEKKVHKLLTKHGADLTPEQRRELLACETREELALLKDSIKPAKKGTLAERARQAGLWDAAEGVVSGGGLPPLGALVDQGCAGRSSEKEVMKGVTDILVSRLAADLDSLRTLADTLLTDPAVLLLSSRRPTAAAGGGKAKGRCLEMQQLQDNLRDKGLLSPSGESSHSAESVNADVFKLYFSFSCPAPRVQAHQMMAMNRGERLGVLQVKVDIPEWYKTRYTKCIQTTYPRFYHRDRQLFLSCVGQAYDRKVEPKLQRKVRAGLKGRAERESLGIMRENMRKLLLTPPIRGKKCIGIDPGFTHGCKVAVVDENSSVLETCVVDIRSQSQVAAAETKITQLAEKFNCEMVAVGNGKGGRNVEDLLSRILRKHPDLFQFSTVSESGASVWSVTKEAEEDLPELAPNLRSAVSIARRLQEPLTELSRMHPKCLSVGQYQHDLPDKLMRVSLADTMEEVISFCGVDLNSTAPHVLQHVAGIGPAMAKKIVEHRTKEGLFVNRQKLNSVKGLGPKTFQQCAGFVKVFTSTQVEDPKPAKRRRKAKVEEEDPNPLDCTIIHPENYDTAEKVLRHFALSKSDIVSGKVFEVFQPTTFTTKPEQLCEILSLSDNDQFDTHTMRLILTAFGQRLTHDIRDEFARPLFKSNVRRLAEVRVGHILQGRVTNRTGFGSFVDVGLERCGLVPNRMGGDSLECGDTVAVSVVQVEPDRGRVCLKFVHRL